MKHAELRPVADGIWAAIALPGRLAIGNAAIVDLGGETLVFDTHFSPGAARDLRGAAEELTGRTPRWVVNSHWHGDHVRGNGEFPEATVLSTSLTRELVATLGEERLAGQKQELELELPGELEALRGAGDEEGARLVEEWAEDFPSFEQRLPEETFESEHDFGRARAITYGGGHTGSDAFLYVPDALVFLAGDLLVIGIQAWAGSGDPAAWVEILDRIAELEIDVAVPGHGPVGGAADLAPMRDYLVELDRAVRDGAERPDLPERFSDWGQPDMWERNVAALRERS